LKVLLDECVDRRLARELASFEVRTVAELGWAGIANGELLRRAALEFEVFLTVDRNLPFQQHLAQYQIAVILVEAVSNRLSDLVKLVPRIVEVIPTAPGGTVTRVGF
jgi:hypothetical protein